MIEIHFRRDPSWAWGNVDGRRFETNGEGKLYRLLTELNRAGFAGTRWAAHDGRMICARGFIRDFSFDLKNGRPPSREWYEKNIGPWPTVESDSTRGAKPRGDVSGPFGVSEAA